MSRAPGSAAHRCTAEPTYEAHDDGSVSAFCASCGWTGTAPATAATLRERLIEATRDPDAHPFTQEHDVEIIEQVVVGWLRDKATQYGDVSLRNLAMYAEDGQA